jgi:DNA-binding MarR family transcriptional regulator
MSQDQKVESREIPSGGSPMKRILAQWRRERPDIDPMPMAVVGEIWRAGERLRQRVQANWANFDLDLAGSDVILTLRRQGRGEALSPSALAKEMMLSTSAMTNRLDRLEERGLIERTLDPNDRRGLNILLTQEGFALADEMIISHVDTEEGMLSKLTDEERAHLCALLAKIQGDI